MNVLVTGGAGYIGSHFVRMLCERGCEVAVVDDLSSGHADAVPPQARLTRARVGDRAAIASVLAECRPDAVVHFAGLIQVGESVRRPDVYWAVNLGQTLALLDEVVRAGVRTFVFSSTAAVYGSPEQVPIPEDHPRRPINPYGATKLAVELALADYGRAFGLRHAALRYFNAAGAHPSGELGERHEPETHLIPLVIDAAMGRRGPVGVFGDDWPTADGTCVRDYVHVQDLAEAHWMALEELQRGGASMTLNLGTGRGVSVHEILQAVQRAAGHPVPHTVEPRREGDPAELVASPRSASERLGWTARCSDIDTIIGDAWRARASRQ